MIITLVVKSVKPLFYNYVTHGPVGSCQGKRHRRLPGWPLRGL